MSMLYTYSFAFILCVAMELFYHEFKSSDTKLKPKFCSIFI